MTDFVGDNDHGDTLPPIEILHKEVVELRKQRLELKKQRDDARRLYCIAVCAEGEPRPMNGIYPPEVFESAKLFAKEIGWDCFK